MENEEKKHVQGKPWKIEGKFKTYEEAKKFFEELKNTENSPEELKIKHLSSSSLFVVKTRRKEEKQEQKKKKNKK